MIWEGLDSCTFPRGDGTVRVWFGMNEHVSIVVHVRNESVTWLVVGYTSHFILELLAIVPFILVRFGISFVVDHSLLFRIPLPWFGEFEGRGIYFVVCCSAPTFWMLEFGEDGPVSWINPATLVAG